MSDLLDSLRAMADSRGEIAYTTNTRSLLSEAEDAGLVKPVSGKFRMVEPGTLNSIYRIVAPAAEGEISPLSPTSEGGGR